MELKKKEEEKNYHGISQNWKKASQTCIIENTVRYMEERTEKN